MALLVGNGNVHVIQKKDTHSKSYSYYLENILKKVSALYYRLQTSLTRRLAAGKGLGIYNLPLYSDTVLVPEKNMHVSLSYRQVRRDS